MEFNDNTPMPFGKYKGTALANVPAGYLLFLYNNGKAGRLKAYIEENMEILRKEAGK